jgi:hypothetical protein
MIVGAAQADNHIALGFVVTDPLNEATAVDVIALKGLEIDAATMFHVNRFGVSLRSQIAVVALITGSRLWPSVNRGAHHGRGYSCFELSHPYSSEEQTYRHIPRMRAPTLIRTP